MARYICEKHGIHYGACATCLKEIQKRRTQNIIDSLRAENEDLHKNYQDIGGKLNEAMAENERLKIIASDLYFAYINKNGDFPHQFETDAIDAFLNPHYQGGQNE